ncbi:unnamed protein product, partial [Durusdinium trenchii]
KPRPTQQDQLCPLHGLIDKPKMGRRRAAAKPPAKARQKLDTMFNCLFCSSLKAVEVKMVRLEKIGFLSFQRLQRLMGGSSCDDCSEPGL